MSTRLKELIHKFMENYNTELLDARATSNFKKPLGEMVRRDIPELLSAYLDKSIYTVKGSVGAGRWTDVPWISVFDKRITKSAQKGVYIVYLLNKDTKELFLTLNQGATSVAQSSDSSELGKSSFAAIAKTNSSKITFNLQNEAIRIRKMIDCNLPYGDIKTGSTAYDAGCIFYKKYDLKSLPEDEALYEDLNTFITAYSDYYNDVFLANSWWPSIDEYNPSFTKEDWLKILNNPDIIGPVWGGVLAMFYTEPNGVTCSVLARKFNVNQSSLRNGITQLGIRIHNLTNCSLAYNGQKEQYWPILCVGRKTDKNEEGVYIWKLRQELYDALTEFGIEKYFPSPTNAWLLTWNPQNWAWSEFSKSKNIIEHGGEYIDEWACSNSHVKIGDRIFMTMLGMGNENGIFASGIVVTEPYQALHYDEEKKKQGITIQKIDVKFDNLLDYKKERILKQTQLIELFPEQKWNPQGSGIEIKSEYITKLEEEWAKLTKKEEIDTMTNKEKLDSIKAYISYQGFSYPDNLVENFYLSLKSKPFVILAGTSGTGKTRLVRLFAEAINAEYKLVPVRPDWSDSSDLFGHVNLNDKFVSGAIIDFIKEANDNPNKPYILCLDEMNLARVEYYLSDFLSIIETRDMRDGIIVTDPLISIDKYGIDTDAIEKYGELSFPENLYVVGTVNMDETTFPFSKKVLDRANTIEFNYVDLMPSFSNNEDVETISVNNAFLKSKYLKLVECTGEDGFIKTACTELQNINLILQTANLHIGYRVRDEIVFYLLNNKNSEDLISYNDAFDNQLLQKILPRVQGSSESIRKMLCELFKHVAGDFELANGNSDSERMQKIIDDNKCKYPKSATKIQMMISRFEDDGFTSYWL